MVESDTAALLDTLVMSSSSLLPSTPHFWAAPSHHGDLAVRCTKLGSLSNINYCSPALQDSTGDKWGHRFLLCSALWMYLVKENIH